MNQDKKSINKGEVVDKGNAARRLCMAVSYSDETRLPAASSLIASFAEAVRAQAGAISGAEIRDTRLKTMYL